MTEFHKQTKEEKRFKLLKDIITSKNGLQLPVDFLYLEVFGNEGIERWCRYNGIKFIYNNEPLKEFMCPQTIIFNSYESPTVS